MGNVGSPHLIITLHNAQSYVAKFYDSAVVKCDRAKVGCDLREVHLGDPSRCPQKKEFDASLDPMKTPIKMNPMDPKSNGWDEPGEFDLAQEKQANQKKDASPKLMPTNQKNGKDAPLPQKKENEIRNNNWNENHKARAAELNLNVKKAESNFIKALEALQSELDSWLAPEKAATPAKKGSKGV